MKKAACVKLFALTIVAASVGGRVEARSPSHSSHAATHETHSSAHTSSRSTTHETRSAAHETRGTQHASGSFRSHGRQVAWQTYGRSEHAALSGRSTRQHRGFSGGGGIQCVTFARADTGIELSGNANTWWDHADGVYQRGNTPEPGSVLNFRANGAMRMGHVAVVNQVVNGRTVVVDHANWGGPGAVRGGVSRNISVVDVSPGNDWSAVRVGLGHSGEYGSIYPTFGFIYNRPDGSGTQMASADTDRVTAVPAMNPAPRDLRPRDQQYDEVAEAPDSPIPTASRHLTHRHRSVVLVNHHAKLKHHH